MSAKPVIVLVRPQLGQNIVFTAQVSGSAPLGAHADVVSGTSSNAQITGGSDQTPVVITAG